VGKLPTLTVCPVASGVQCSEGAEHTRATDACLGIPFDDPGKSVGCGVLHRQRAIAARAWRMAAPENQRQVKRTGAARLSPGLFPFSRAAFRHLYLYRRFIGAIAAPQTIVDDDRFAFPGRHRWYSHGPDGMFTRIPPRPRHQLILLAQDQGAQLLGIRHDAHLGYLANEDNRIRPLISRSAGLRICCSTGRPDGGSFHRKVMANDMLVILQRPAQLLYM